MGMAASTAYELEGRGTRVCLMRVWGMALLGSLIACGGRTPSKAEEPMDAGVDAEPDAGPPTELRESDKLDVLFRGRQHAHRQLRASGTVAGRFRISSIAF